MRSIRFLSFCLALAALPACGIRGDRAATGECPDGETCSDATPSGLVFTGTHVSGTLAGSTTIAPVAIGGTERITIRTRFEERLPAFDAVTSSDAVTVDGVVGTEITIGGASAGTALLRILDRADGGTLLDRTTVEAAAVDRARVTQTEDLSVMLAPEVRDVVFAPGEHVIGIHLLDATSRIVVDQGMSIDAGAIPTTVEAWDAIRLTVPEGGLDLAVAAAGSDFPVRVESAGAIDDLELATWLLQLDASERPQLSAGDSVCAVPLSGGARVIGASSVARFTLDGAELTVMDGATTDCASMPDAPTPGTSELAVTFGDATRTFAVQVVEPGAASSPLVWSGARSLGGRARALGDRARLGVR